MFELVRRRLVEHLPEGARDARAGDRILVLDASRGVVDGACFIAVDAGGAPRLVAKAARTDAGAAIFRAEHETLTTLEARGMNRGGARVPHPIGAWTDGGVLITLQTALSGRMLKNEPGRSFFSTRAFGATLDTVEAWLSRFHETHGVTTVELTAEIYAREVMRPLERFLERFRNAEPDRRFLRRRLVEERRLEGLKLPLPARHGDFCTANMVLQPHGLGVFDWEFALEPRLPLFDLFYFLSSTRYPFRGWRGESGHFDSFRAVFWGDDVFSRTARRAIREYASRCGIPRDALGDLFLCALLDVANMKYEALVESQLTEPDRDVPFASIDDGVSRNVELVTTLGLPEL